MAFKEPKNHAIEKRIIKIEIDAIKVNNAQVVWVLNNDVQ